MPKDSSKLIVWTDEDPAKRKGFFVYRAPGPWTNPNSLSMLGTDGRDGATLIAQVKQKLGLVTRPQDWRELGSIENPANDEVNHVFEYVFPMQALVLDHRAYGGLMVFQPAKLWDFAKPDAPIKLSPALATIMAGMPDIFGKPTDA